ncbi:MAG TPA: recombinase family protein [Thermoanaerobaculia bacterium]|nr:recombinase family protein [Thermoanaerobaculia bacterium]
MRVALYLRRSTNEELQADSLRRQERILRRYAETHGHVVVAVFSDSASGRSVAGRDDFLRLIGTVKRGAGFEGILVLDVSRWGRFGNPDEAAYYEWICVTHGVSVIYAEEEFPGGESPLATLQKAMKRWMAAQFSRDRARLTQSSQARVVEQGFMHGGGPPYGLKRVLVKLDGTYVRDMEPGERKALSTMRIKLFPGDPAKVEVVRAMFRSYADGITLHDIAVSLNERGIRGAQGGRWHAGMVAYLLRNEAYKGVAKYTVRNGAERSELQDRADDNDGHVIRTIGAYVPLIDHETWQAVQQRMRSRTWRKTNRDLADELRQAFERWGSVGKAMLATLENPSHWETYRNRFRNGYAEALETAYETEVTAARDQFLAQLSPRFHLRKFEEGWLVDDLLYIRFLPAWPHAGRGGLYWRFPFTGKELEDVTVGLAFSPPPIVANVEQFLFQTSHFVKRPRVILRSLTPRRKPAQYVTTRSPEETIRYFNSAIYFRNKRAERRLQEFMGDRPLAVITEIARELGWPVNATRVLYRRLEAKGVFVPPLKKRAGRRIDLVCPGCHSVRRMVPSEALQRTTDRCFDCTHRLPTNKISVFCPACGTERKCWPSQIAVMKDGVESLCHRCALKKGRAVRRENREFENASRSSIAVFAQNVLAALIRIYPDAKSPANYRGPYPVFHWHDSEGKRIRLSFRCSHEALAMIVASPAEERLVDAALDRSAWTPTRCDRRHDKAWTIRLK